MTYDFREARILDLTREQALTTLGFKPDDNPSAQELRAAQKRSALAVHPDRGGSVEKMQDVNRAYDFLLNAPKRRLDPSPPRPGSPARPGPQDDDFWHGREQQKAPEPVKFTFEQAKAQANVPSDVDWQFTTEWQRSPGNFIGETSSSKSHFVAYGRKVDLHIFVVVSYFMREFGPGSSLPDKDVWGVAYFRYVIKDEAKESKNPAWLTAQVVKALNFFHGDNEFDGKFNNKVRDAKDWKFQDTPAKGNSVSMKHWLVESGQVEGTAPSVSKRKHVIELKMERNPFEQKPGYYDSKRSPGNFYKFTLLINGKGYDLNKTETEEFLNLNLGSQRSIEAIYGEYYYGGEKKNLTRMKGKGLFFVSWFLQNMKSLPEDAVKNLETAKQQLS